MLGTPLALGGVHKPVILLACLVSCLTLGCLFHHRRSTHRKLRVTWFGLLLMGLTAYTVLQIVPLPQKLLSLLAPNTLAVLKSSLAGIPGAMGWHPISLDPGATFWEALKIGTCALAFISAHNFLYRASRRKRMLTLLTGGGVLLVFIGFIGAVVAPKQPLLFYAPSSSGGGGGLITTSFVNPNHGAAFLLICAMAAVGLALSARDVQKKLMMVIVGVLLGTGVFLTLSRGGILVLASGLVFFTGLLLLTRYLITHSRTSTPSFPASLFGRHFRHSSQTRMSSSIAVLPAMVAAILVASSWLAYSEVTREFAHLVPDGSADWSKIKLWPSGLALVLANPFVGVGRGAFMTVFPRYLEMDLPNNVYSHMENQYIHLPAEWGILVAAVAILASATALWMWFVKGHHGARSLSVIAALLAVALHNAIDFNLEILGVALPVAVLAGLLSAGVTSPRTHRKGSSSKARVTPRAALALGMASALTVMALWAAAAGPPDPWEDDAHLAALVRKKVPLEQFRKEAQGVIMRHPSDHMPHLAYARYAAGLGKSEALASLNKAMFLFPRSPQIHLETARTLRRFGKRGQALLEYRFALEYGARNKRVLQEAFSLIRTSRDLEVLLPPVPRVQSTMVELLLMSARRSARKSAPEKAAARVKMAHEVVTRAKKDWPNHREVQMAAIKVLLALGKTAKARVDAEELIHRHVTPDTYGLLARAAGMDRGPKAAVAVLTKAQRLYPLHKDTAFNLARAHLAARDYDSAVKVVKQIQEHSQSTKLLVKTHGLLAHIYKVSGNHHLARHHADQVRRLRGKR